METLSKLKGVITSGETSGDMRTRRNELYRLMRELQERKKLQQLVSRAGTAIRGAKAVAKELVEHWDQVSTPMGATEEECVVYLKTLGVEQRLRKAGLLLFKQLSLDIVHEGLKRLSSNSSPRLDGFSAKFFKRFSEIFEPQMYESLKRFLDVGTMPETWTSGVVTMIPKTKAMQTPDSLSTNCGANDTAEVAHQHSPDPVRGCTSPLHPITANGFPSSQKYPPACLWVTGTLGWLT